MTILVLCARGKTGSRLCSLLKAADISFLAAMRSPSASSNHPNCHFDWMDSTTYENPFSVSSDLNMTAISAVYLIHPPATDAMGLRLNNFIDVARSNGVRRFVLLSASNIEKGGPAMGKAHEYLAGLREIEYAVLRPTWFMQNFSEGEHLQSIRDDNVIVSAAGDGKVPFVSVEDISRVAFHALTDEKIHSDEYHIVGPQLLSYDQIASILTKILGRKISHLSLDGTEFAQHLTAKYGYSAELAAMLAYMDVAVKKGSEDRLSDTVQKVTGAYPEGFYDFAMRQRQCWL